MAVPPQVRQCSLYRITVWNPHDGYRTKWRGYIGETERLPIERIAEHLKAQYPWGDTIAAIEVDDRVWPDKASVWRAEQAAVHAEQPLYNAEYNQANPWRISYADQVLQRHDRDRAEGRPLWQPGRGQVRRPRPVPPPARRRSWRVRWTFWHAVVPAWCLLSVLVWTLLGGGWDAVVGAVPETRVAVGWSPLPAGLAALGLVRWAWRRGARWGRRRRR